MALTILKRTPIHAVVEVSGANANETINLNSTLAVPSRQTVDTPLANIRGIRWSVPSGNATITRNGVLLWTLTGSDELRFEGFADTRQNGQNIVVVIPAGGGTVILEMAKISGYGDTQHVNPSPTAVIG